MHSTSKKATTGCETQRLQSRINHLTRATCALAAALAIGLVGWAPVVDTEDPDLEEIEDRQPAREESGGDTPYNLSRLEWIAVRSNSLLQLDTWSEHGFIVQFMEGERGSNTIRIVATYDRRRVNQERMRLDGRAAGQQLNEWAKRRGWDEWLIIKEEYIGR